MCGHRPDAALSDHSTSIPTTPTPSAAHIQWLLAWACTWTESGICRVVDGKKWRQPLCLLERVSFDQVAPHTPSESIVDCAKIDNGRIDDQSLVW